MSQSHFTLSFPLKSPVDAKTIAEELPPLVPGLFVAQDAIGTIHYSRFTVLSEKALLFLGDFDGEFSQLMADLARQAGPVFDAIVQYVESPPPTPVAGNVDAFVEWIAGRLLHPLNTFTAYPDVTVKEIKALASAAGVSGAGVLNPFLVILHAKSRLAFIEMQLLLRARSRGTQRDLEKVGTPHFAQFVPLEDNQVGFLPCISTRISPTSQKNIGPSASRGIFPTPSVYPAIVRFGNADPKVNSDFKADVRSLSFSVDLTHDGPKPDVNVGRQDFSLQNATTLPINDSPAFLAIMKLLTASRPATCLWSLPFRDQLRVLRVLTLVQLQAHQKIRPYQQLRYWSTVRFPAVRDAARRAQAAQQPR
jgi:hypothetical protein